MRKAAAEPDQMSRDRQQRKTDKGQAGYRPKYRQNTDKI